MFCFSFVPPGWLGLCGGGSGLARWRCRGWLDLFGFGSGNKFRLACLYGETGLDHRIIAAEHCHGVVETLRLEIKHRTGA
jgi:hypothetical protein